MSLIITLSGMSTSGKSTLAQALAKSNNFKEAVSVTTRPMRPGETDGVDYYFVDNHQFNEFIGKGLMLEYVQSHNASYGVLSLEVEKILDSGKSPVLVIEPIGVNSMNTIALQRNYSMVSGFIDTDMSTIMARFMERIYNQISIGKDINYNQEAKRLHTIMTIEKTWEHVWPWDVSLNNLHKDGNMNKGIELLTDFHTRSDEFKPREKSLKSSIKVRNFKSIEAIEKIIEKTVNESISSDQFYKIIDKSPENKNKNNIDLLP